MLKAKFNWSANTLCPKHSLPSKKAKNKSRGIAILNCSDYKEGIERQVTIMNNSMVIPYSVLHEVAKKLQKCLKDELDKHTFEYLNPWKQKICTPVLYNMLPAIHRAPPVSLKFADRPIISTYGSPTMIQIYGRFCLPFYAKYTSHILEILEATPFPEKYYLWSLTWYPNTPQEALL